MIWGCMLERSFNLCSGAHWSHQETGRKFSALLVFLVLILRDNEIHAPLQSPCHLLISHRQVLALCRIKRACPWLSRAPSRESTAHQLWEEGQQQRGHAMPANGITLQIWDGCWCLITSTHPESAVAQASHCYWSILALDRTSFVSDEVKDAWKWRGSQSVTWYLTALEWLTSSYWRHSRQPQNL